MRFWREAKWRKLAIALAAFAGLSFVLGFVAEYHLPRLKSWLLVEVERQSARHLPIRIWPQSVKFSAIPLALTLENVRLLPQGELKSQLAPTVIKEVRVSLSLLGLFKGRLRVGEFRIAGADIKYFLPKIESNDEPVDLRFDLDEIYNLPVDQVTLEDLNIWVRVREPAYSLQAKDLSLSIENSYRALLVDLNAPILRLKKSATKPILNLTVETKVLVRDNRLQVSALKVKKDASYVVASGTVYGRVDRMQFEDANLQAKTHIELSEAEALARELLTDTAIPPLAGSVDFGFNIEHQPGTNSKVRFTVATDKAVVDGFEIGSLTGEGEFARDRIAMPRVEFRHPAGRATVNGLVVKVDRDGLLQGRPPAELSVHGSVLTKDLDLRRLLEGVRVKNVPVNLRMNAELPCGGEILPKLNLTCKGAAEGRGLSVWSGGRERFPIVDLDEFQAAGEFTVGAQQVSYKADVRVGESKGQSSGTISYEKGFKIAYEGEIKNLKAIKNLARLKLEGGAKVRGTTEGNSRYGVIDMDLQLQDAWLEDFGLGRVKTQLRYKDGMLIFREIDGFFGTTKYNGNVSLNLYKNRLFAAIQAPYIDAEEITTLIGRKVPIPVAITGTGSAKAKVRGPFRLNQMSFELESALFRGTVAGESYDKAFVNMRAEDGLVNTERVELFKSSGRIDFRGKLSPEGELDAVLLGRELRLEQSENLERVGLKVMGQLDASMALRGPITRPNLLLNGRVSKLMLADQPADDSRFQIKINEHRMEGSGRFVGEQVSAEVIYPFKPGTPFSLKVNTRNWNFTQFFGMFSSIATQRTYETRLTAGLNLNSSSGEFWRSSGLLAVDKFLIKRGPLRLESPPEPMLIRIQDGEWRTENFRVSGESSFLELVAKPSNRTRMEMSLNGKIDLSLGILFTPFLEDLRGTLSLSTQIRGPVENPQILGSAYVQQGFVRLKAFPHPFEGVNADMLFSQNNILLNAIRARIGGGDLNADGRITFKGEESVPVDVKGRFENVSLNIPEGFRTRGSGTIYFRGKGFPYELGGRYEVAKTDVAKDFSASKAEQQTVRPSTFLPKFLMEDVFQPISLNLDIDLLQPAAVKMIVNNAQIEAPVSGRVSVRNYPNQPLLTGRFTSGPPGRVTFRNNVFDIRTAQVEYQNAAPENPNIYLSAETRLRAEYDVTLNMQGPAKKPKIEMRSQPPLPEHELISLLALGVTSSDLDGRNLQQLRRNQGGVSGDQQATQAGLEIGSALIKDQLGLNRGIQDKLGFEVDISQSFDATNNTSVPSVTLRKQWTPNFGASGSQTLGGVPGNNFRAEYRFNRNFSVIGFFDSRQPQQQQTEIENRERVGVDLEYKIEFK